MIASPAVVIVDLFSGFQWFSDYHHEVVILILILPPSVVVDFPKSSVISHFFHLFRVKDLSSKYLFPHVFNPNAIFLSLFHVILVVIFRMVTRNITDAPYFLAVREILRWVFMVNGKQRFKSLEYFLFRVGFLRFFRVTIDETRILLVVSY